MERQHKTGCRLCQKSKIGTQEELRVWLDSHECPAIAQFSQLVAILSLAQLEALRGVTRNTRQQAVLSRQIPAMKSRGG